MNNVLPIIFLISSTIPVNSSSSRINLVTLGQPANTIEIQSEGLSNSQDQYLTTPVTYNSLFKDIRVRVTNNSEVLREKCRENIAVTKINYLIEGFPFYHYLIEIDHHHEFVGSFLRIGGKRTLLVNEIPIKSFYFQPDKVIGPQSFKFTFSEEKTIKNSVLYVCNEEYKNSYYMTHEYKVIPGERYLIQFKYLLAYTDDGIFEISRFYESLASWKSLEPIQFKLKGDNKNYYRQFNKIINPKDYNSILFKFKVECGDEVLRQFFVSDLKVVRLGNRAEENP